MAKKIITVFFILILLGNIVSAYSIKNTVKNNSQSDNYNILDTATIYVDDDNTNGPWDGSREHPYKEIWRGLEEAFQGDNVYVLSGTYTYVETTIKIEKSISLIGENRKNTVIDGYNKKNVVEIKADNVKLHGFTIKNSGEGYSGISISSNSNIIYDNLISDNSRGIYIESYSKNNIIYDNDLVNNGVVTFSLNEHEIYDNTINGKILVYKYEQSNQKITDAGQVILVKCSDIKIKNCDLSYASIGITVLNCENCNIINTSISNNKYGIYVSSSTGIWITVEPMDFETNNKIFENDIGIYFILTKGYISNNKIYENKEKGIFLSDSDGCSIYGNVINENNGAGIHLKHYSDENSIYDNYIDKNQGPGLLIEYNSNENQIYHNQFYDNSPNAEQIRCQENTYNIIESGVGSGNYWNDYEEIYPDIEHNGKYWDDPYEISDNCKDNYPLIQPYGNPYPPKVYGKQKIGKGKEYTFTAKSTDPRLGTGGYDLYYFFDWGDGNNSGWIGPYKENKKVESSHTWYKVENFEVKVKVKNKYNWTSGWSEPISISVSESDSNKKFFDIFKYDSFQIRDIFLKILLNLV